MPDNQQQGILASRISKLGEQHDDILPEPEIHKMSELREAYREVGQDLLKLLFFVEMNAIGLREILKKFDKCFGYRFIDYYAKTHVNHPYSRLQQVFKHVGIGAVVGLSRNLHELQNRQGIYLSIYDQPALPLQDPVIDSIKAVVDRLGSARAVNKRYISDCVPLKIRMQASAACGPALAGILQTDFKIYKLTFNQNTLPGWVMGVAWLIYLVSLWITFKEPSHEPVENENHANNHQPNNEVNDALEQGLKQPLLITSDDKGDEEADQDYDDSEEASEESRLPATSIRSAYRLKPSAKICVQLTVSHRVWVFYQVLRISLHVDV
ncbi:hypothetical protein AHAS_Ahas15G0412300 [Arachis hypogaea]